MILRVLEKRDGIKIDTVEEALNGLADDGFSKIYIQPTHVINGDEYEKMLRDIDRVESRFETVKVGTPLLTETSDYQIVAKEILSQLPKLDKKEALVLMGHGTEHHVNAVYPAMDYHFKAMGHPNVFVGTVEGYPDLETVLNQVNQYKPEKIVLLPFMVVAGDHACNDMAGDEEDSWKSVFEAEGYQVDTMLPAFVKAKSSRYSIVALLWSMPAIVIYKFSPTFQLFFLSTNLNTFYQLFRFLPIP
jgi:cobalamin biosynthesis Co2+ chelatase CbiK